MLKTYSRFFWIENIKQTTQSTNAAAPDEVEQPLEYEGDPVDVEDLQRHQPYAEEVEGGKVARHLERVVVHTVQHPERLCEHIIFAI